MKYKGISCFIVDANLPGVKPGSQGIARRVRYSISDDATGRREHHERSDGRLADWYDKPYHWFMTVHTASSARSRLFQLIDEVAEAHTPIEIVGKRNSAVLVAEEDWRAIQETLYLLSIPNMRESLLKAAREPRAKMARTPKW